MLFEDSMSNVDESAIESESSSEDPIVSSMKMKTDMTPLNPLMMMTFYFPNYCLIQ
jgi:hypothetical protein